jgi:protein-tyrosine phosphatase
MGAPTSTERRVLVVCTANVCRSPVAERALQREWAACGIPAKVTSAGIRGGRLEVHPYTVEAAGFAKLDLTDHRSRRLDPDLLTTAGADLVLGMTREHLRGAIELDPGCWPRAFTLRELARRIAELTDPDETDTDWDAWLAACHTGRDLQTLLIPDLVDDLPDPYGQPAGAHILMVQEITLLARTIARATPRPDTDASNTWPPPP